MTKDNHTGEVKLKSFLKLDKMIYSIYNINKCSCPASTIFSDPTIFNIPSHITATCQIFNKWCVFYKVVFRLPKTTMNQITTGLRSRESGTRNTPNWEGCSPYGILKTSIKIKTPFSGS